MTISQTKRAGFNTIISVLTLAVVALSAFLLFSFNDTTNTNSNSTPTSTESELINIDSPEANTSISSPLTISGEARGQWYFESDFPVEVVDNVGNSLGTTPVTAQDDWMTEDFVPFADEIEFDATTAETDDGRVIFHRSNPSGLAENDDSVEIPITFSDTDTASSTTVQVFWSDNSAAVAGDCSVVESFEREIPQTQAVGQAALSELLTGPTTEEESSGFSSNIPDDVSVNSLRVEDGVAYADFSPELNNAAGSCRVTAIYNQINETLMQFSSVNEVEISVDGETEAVLQP